MSRRKSSSKKIYCEMFFRTATLDTEDITGTLIVLIISTKEYKSCTKKTDTGYVIAI